MPSCRSEPGSPGTWTAKPGYVPPPNAGPGGSSRPDWSNFSSPIRRICSWYPASATVRWPVGLSYPLSRHRFWVPSGRSTSVSFEFGFSLTKTENDYPILSLSADVPDFVLRFPSTVSRSECSFGSAACSWNALRNVSMASVNVANGAVVDRSIRPRGSL